MDFARLGVVWRAEPAPVVEPGSLAPLLRRLEGLERTVRRRDWVETGSALLMVPLFAGVALAASDRVVRLGALVVVAACLLIPWRLRAARRPPLDRGLSIAEALRQELDRVTAQQRLLRSVLWWYLGPLGLGVALIVVGSVPSFWPATATLVVMTWLYWQIWRLNQRTVERQLEPRIGEILSWLESLEEGPRPKPLPGDDV